MTAPAVDAPGAPPRPATLRWAAGLVVAQTAGEAVAIVARHDLRWPLRIALVLIISAQLLFARGLLHLSAGAAFAVFAYQIAGVVTALGAHGALVWRGVLAGSAVAVFALLAGSLGAFPEPEPPTNRRGPR